MFGSGPKSALAPELDTKTENTLAVAQNSSFPPSSVPRRPPRSSSLASEIPKTIAEVRSKPFPAHGFAKCLPPRKDPFVSSTRRRASFLSFPYFRALCRSSTNNRPPARIRVRNASASFRSSDQAHLEPNIREFVSIPAPRPPFPIMDPSISPRVIFFFATRGSECPMNGCSRPSEPAGQGPSAHLSRLGGKNNPKN